MYHAWIDTIEQMRLSKCGPCERIDLTITLFRHGGTVCNLMDGMEYRPNVTIAPSQPPYCI
jgi:hypothetical protein